MKSSFVRGWNEISSSSSDDDVPNIDEDAVPPSARRLLTPKGSSSEQVGSVVEVRIELPLLVSARLLARVEHRILVVLVVVFPCS